MMIKNPEAYFDFLSAWQDGSRGLDAIEKARYLATLSMRYKAASTTYLRADSTAPVGLIRMEWDQFLRKAMEHEMHSLIYEYSSLAIKKNYFFPVNLLTAMIRYAEKYPQIAASILSCVGPCGQWIMSVNPDWRYLLAEPEYLRSLQNDAKRMLLSARQLLALQPDKLWDLILDETISEKIILQVLPEWRAHHDLVSTQSLEELRKKYFSRKSLEAFMMRLLLATNEQRESLAKEVADRCQGGDLSSLLQHPILKTIQGKADIKKILRIIPTYWILSSSTPDLLIKEMIDEQYLDMLADSIALHRDTYSSKLILRYLIRNNLFTENRPVEKLSQALDYVAFNEIARYALQQGGSNTDLEAFLFLLQPFRHFWSDELLDDILTMFKNKKLEERFNFEVFFDLIPYRMNPNSNRMNDIPNTIRSSVERPFSFQSVIHFRKILRK